MSKSGANQLFFTLVGVGVLTALAIPQSVTDRAKGKEELLLYPVIKPVRVIAAMSSSGRRVVSPGGRGLWANLEWIRRAIAPTGLDTG